MLVCSSSVLRQCVTAGANPIAVKKGIDKTQVGLGWLLLQAAAAAAAHMALA
jgi:hypothetical protein